jgi:hypothetical protein
MTMTIDDQKIVTRYITPSRLDLAAYGNVVRVIGMDNQIQYFVQLSNDLTYADWKPIGYLLEEVFHDFVTNKDFLDACLALYNNPASQKESLSKISALLHSGV